MSQELSFLLERASELMDTYRNSSSDVMWMVLLVLGAGVVTDRLPDLIRQVICDWVPDMR